MSVLEGCFVKGDEFITRHIAGETLIVPVKGHVSDLDSIYTLNEVGSRIWELIDRSRPVAQIVRTIQDEYEVTEAEAARDCLELFDALQTAGLIRPSRKL